MKHFCFLILFLLSILPSCCIAQRRVTNGIPQKNVAHFKFQGIPITGNIHSFCSQLYGKGFRFDHELNKNDDEVVHLIGKYLSHDATLEVYKDEETVYAVKVRLGFENEEDVSKMEGNLLGALRVKYPRLIDAPEESFSEDNDGYRYSQYVCYVPRPGNSDPKNFLGEISICITQCVVGGWVLDITFADEYNQPEWRKAREDYVQSKKVAESL